MPPEKDNDAHCPYHREHEYRIKQCEARDVEHDERFDTLEATVKNPALTIAVISFLGIIFSASAAFAGVVMSPVLQVAFRSWGWL